MNTKLLGSSLAAIFVVSMVGLATANGITWLPFDNGSQNAVGEGQKTVLTVTADDAVPMHTDALAGYAWFYEGNTDYTAFAITTHNAPTFVDDDAYNEIRDSTQNPNNWHAHNVILSGPPNMTNEIDFCVFSLADAPKAGISFDDDTDLVQVNVKNSALQDDLSNPLTVASFYIVPPIAGNPSGCPATIGTENYGDANNPVGPVPLGIKVAQIDTLS